MRGASEDRFEPYKTYGENWAEASNKAGEDFGSAISEFRR